MSETADTQSAHLWYTWVGLSGFAKLELLNATHDHMVNVCVERTEFASSLGHVSSAEHDPAFLAASERFWLVQLLMDVDTGKYN